MHYWKVCTFGLLAALLWGSLLIMDSIFPPRLDLYHRRSHLVLDREGKVLHASLTPGGRWRFPVRPAEVSPLYLRMLLAFEDKRFYHHPGVDPLAVARSIWQLVRWKKVISGASTLTMQVVRLLEPRPRTFRTKLLEMLRALQLEWHFKKEEILSIYLTLTPFGGNLEGVRAASLAYFGKEPQWFSPSKAALLVALPQSPTRLRPDRHPQRARAARNKVLTRMARAGVLSGDLAIESMKDPVPTGRQPRPRVAPHLSRRLWTDGGEITLHRTWIDPRFQYAVQRLVRRAAKASGPAVSTAVLVVENKTRNVISYVGSAGFFEEDRHGQVDMVIRRRSPGSTLKPFIYGLAMDEGLIHPETIVRDSRVRFGSYAPSNFDGDFHGEVTVREALQRSLNIPAVRVLNRVGPSRVMGEFRSAGVFPKLSGLSGEPGLALALGGVGLTLEELVTLFAALPDGGMVKSLRLTKKPTASKSAEKKRMSDSGKLFPRRTHRLMGPAAAWYLTRILEGTPRPPKRVQETSATSHAPIAFKTGTSYGYRDAWAIGYNRRYTVGVWTGRPDGTPVPGLTGRETAAPLLFQIFEQLPPVPRLTGEKTPKGVIIAANPELPLHLRRFERPDPGSAYFVRGRIDPLSLEFPLHGSTVELNGTVSRIDSLPLIAHGGNGPFTWLINGRLIAGKRRENDWMPDGFGFVRVTVVDAIGKSASAELEIR